MNFPDLKFKPKGWLVFKTVLIRNSLCIQKLEGTKMFYMVHAYEKSATLLKELILLHCLDQIRICLKICFYNYDSNLL